MRLEIIKNKGYIFELLEGADFNNHTNEQKADAIVKVIEEVEQLVKANSVLGDVSVRRKCFVEGYKYMRSQCESMKKYPFDSAAKITANIAFDDYEKDSR